MEIECQTKVDYLQQERKATRGNSKGIVISKEGNSVVLFIKSSKVSFNLELSLSKIYSKFINEGKMTLEMVLPGGAFCNVLISQASTESLNKLLHICKVVLENPDEIDELDLGRHRSKKDEEAIEV